jgi:plastocyanin
LELAAVSSVFDVTELEAPAGPITIEFDNRDAGIVHNVAVYPGDDASEDPIGATELEPGPIQQELQLDLSAGAYFYQCDAHPSTMSGSLTVE